MALKVSSALFADGGTLPSSAVFNGFGLTGELLMFCVNGHILDQGRLTAVFAR